MNNMQRLEKIVARLPEAQRVDIEAWGGEPTFRVRQQELHLHRPRGDGHQREAAEGGGAAVVATDESAEPTGYGLGRHGWVSVKIAKDASKARWQEIEEWVRTSYTLVAPKTLARQVEAEDGIA